MPSYSDVRVALLQIGVDVTNPQSVEEFNDTQSWARETRKRCERWQVIIRQIAIGGLVAFMGGVFAAIISWVTSRGSLWGPH